MTGAMATLCFHLPVAEILRRRGIVWNGRGCELGIWTGCLLVLSIGVLNLFTRITFAM